MTGDITIPISTEKGFRYGLNQLMCMILCTYMTLPYFRQYLNMYVLVAVVGLWFITTDLTWLTTRLSKDLVFVVLFFASFIPNVLTGTLGYGRFVEGALPVAIPIFFLGIVINHYYMYYKRDFNTLGKIALVSMGMYIIGAVQTYLGLLRFPTASRDLAGGISLQDPTLGAFYRQLGIGGFGYIYASCFIFIAVSYLLIRKSTGLSRRYKVVSFVSILAISLMVYKASYATAVILVLVGLTLAMVVKNRRTFIVIMVLATFFLLLFPQELIGEILLKFAGLFNDNSTLHTRFTQVAVSFLPDIGGFGTISRWSRYTISASTFLKHPFFGIYGSPGGVSDANSYSVIGGHSGWLDLLAFYGLFAGAPLFFAIYFNIRKHMSFFKDEIFYGSILVTSFLFVVLGFINPNLTIFEIGFAQFCIVPAIPFLSYAFVPNIRVLEKYEPIESQVEEEDY